MSEATYVPILPDLSTFFKETSKGAKSAGQQAGRDFADGMTREVQKAERAVESATKAQERASARAEDATAKRRLEEQKLNEVLEKGTAKVSEIMAATQRYEKAQRDEAQATKNAEKANTDLIKRKQDLSKASDEVSGAVRVGADDLDEYGEAARGAAGKIGDLVGASEGIGSKLMGGLKTIGTGALLGVGAKIGTTITSGISSGFSAGFSRLQSVEQAEKMLQGLGHSTESTANILDNAMQSVKGTAFGFGEAASMAATFVGAGIPEGEELTRVLTLVGDSAAIAGADFQEMGSIWTKIASGQRMSTEELNQLMDRGLGLLPKLQEKYGVTADEARKMITDGKVSFEDFADVMENMVGGSAQSMGETFGGSLSNMQAALGRLGAKFLEPVFENAPAIFSAVGGAVDKLGEKLDPIISSWSERMQPVFERFAEWIGPALEQSIDGIADGLAAMVGWVQDNATWLKPLVAMAAGAATAYAAWTTAIWAYNAAKTAWAARTKIATGVQAAFNLVMAANPIMLVVMAIGALTAGLVYFFTQTETGRELWGKFTTALSDGWNLAVGALSAGWEWLKTTVFDAWTNTVAAVQAHWNLTTNAIAFGWAWLKNELLTRWFELKTTVFDAWNNAVAFIQASWNLATNALAFAWAWVKDQFVTTWTTVKTAVFDAWNAAVTWVQEKFDQVTGALSSAWSLLKDNLVTTWTTVKTTVFDAMTSALDTVKGWFSTTVDAIGTTWDKLRALTAKPVRFVVETVYGGIRNAWNKVAGLVGLGELPEVPLGNLGAYARGGVLPGYTPGRDVHTFMSPTGGTIHLSGGEAIMRPEVTRALGTDRVDALNAAARMGGVPAVQKHLGGFAAGGVIGSISNLVREKFPMMTITSTYRAGDPGHHGAGRAVDFSNGTDTTPQMQAATAWFATNYGKELLELIHSPSPHNIKNGRSVGDGFGFYGAGTMNAHRNHVHVAASAPLAGGGSGGVLGFLEGAVTSVADMAKSAWDSVIDKIPAYNDTGGLFGELPGAFLKKAAGAAWSFIADKASSVGAWFGSPGSGVEQWRPLVEKVLTAKGLSLDLADTTLRRMNQESGGNPRAINDWDINAKNGTPSKGLMQVIDPTFAAHKDPGFNDIWDPESNIRASMNYTLARYGSLPAGYNRAGGYHLGGLAPAGRGFMPKTALEPEMVLNPKMTKAFIDWMNGSPRGESAAVVARELSSAFRGGDWGYGELASVLGREDWAKAIVNGAAVLGGISREVEGIAADALGDTGRSALGFFGLDPLVDVGEGLHSRWAAMEPSAIESPTVPTSPTIDTPDLGDAGPADNPAVSGGMTVVINLDGVEVLRKRIDGAEEQIDVNTADIDALKHKRPPAATVTRGGVL